MLRHCLWRWHFFAGLVVCPFAILLAITGAIYLFKSQIAAYEEARINALAPAVATAPTHSAFDSYLKDLLTGNPGAQLKRAVLNKPSDRSFEVELRHVDNRLVTYWLDIYTGKVIAVKNSDRRFLQIVKKLHSELLFGNTGSYVVELMASWLIILIVSGLYLWLSKPGKETGKTRRFFLPQLSAKKKVLTWRSLHGVLGLWFAIPILILLLTGLPWTQLWGAGFDRVKTLAGWQGPGQEWFVTLQSKIPDSRRVSELDSGLWEIRSDKREAKNTSEVFDFFSSATRVTLDDIINKPEIAELKHPVYIMPPKPNNGVWTVRAMPAQRSERVTLHYDQYSGDEIMRIEFQDHHPVQRFVSHGISLHEGALFGWLNQALGVLTALAVIFVSCFGLYLWWLRKPKGKLGAPPLGTGEFPKGLVFLIFAFAVFLPAAALSFGGILLLEFLWARRTWVMQAD